MTNSPLDELLTVQQVAELTKFSRGRVYRLAARGVLPAPIRIGHRVRWRRSDLLAWLASAPARTAAEAGR